MTTQDTKRIVSRWGHPFADDVQWVHIPGWILRNYAAAGATPLQMMFVAHIMAFKYDQAEGGAENDAAPSLVTIAKYMGRDVRNVRRIKSALIKTGLLAVTSQAGNCDLYDFGQLAQKCFVIEAEKLTAPDKIIRATSVRNKSAPDKNARPPRIKTPGVPRIKTPAENIEDKNQKDIEESVPGSAGTPVPSENGESQSSEEETEEFTPPGGNPPPTNRPETEPQPAAKTPSGRPPLPPPALMSTYQCERCQKTMTAPPRDLGRTSWRQPAAAPKPGEIALSLCPDCQKSQAWQPGDRVTWLHESRNGYGYVTQVAGVVRSVSAQRVEIAVFENGKAVFRHVKPEKLKARDSPIEREAELESAEAPVQPHIALINAWWAAIPGDLRPPGDPPIEPNVKTARDLLDDGITPERIQAFVSGTYESYLTWTAKNDAPPLMSLEHVRKYLKGWEAKQVKRAEKTSKPRSLPPPPFNWAKASAKEDKQGGDTA